MRLFSLLCPVPSPFPNMFRIFYDTAPTCISFFFCNLWHVFLNYIFCRCSCTSRNPPPPLVQAPPHSRHEQQAAWQFFSPSPKSPSNPSGSAALQQGKASLPSSADSKRRGRLQVGSTVAGGSAVSPAQMYRVSRSAGPGRLMLPGESSRDAGREEGLQSPRSAIAGAGRDYPELLTVYSAAPTSSIAEEIGEGVVAGGGEFGRPALPLLSEEDLTQLRAGQRVQKQTREGGSGSGSVVVDVRADPDVVLGLLTKYEDYAEMIDTVRRCEVFPEGSADNRMVRCALPYRVFVCVGWALL